MEFPLTKNQQSVFNTVEGNNTNLLIHGKPGVGKSVLIRALTEEGRKTYSLAAPTGLAALNIGGKTLHSIFRIPVSEGIIEPTFNKFPNDDRVINNIKYNIHHLIIDEISMVRADVFDYLDRLMRYCKGKEDLPFGGAQLIVIGDFFQLPPVVKREENQQLRLVGYSSPFIFSSKVFQGHFKTLTLDEVLRQKGDPAFIDILHHARTGEVKPGHMKLLNKQVGHPDDLRIKLAGTNAMAEAINQGELKKIQQPAVTFEAYKFGEWPQDPVEQLLTLKVGAQVMVKMNGADKPEGIRGGGEFKSQVVNGTLGIIKEIPTPTAEGVETVILEKENGTLVTIYRKRWERKIKEKDSDGKWEERVIASFEQMPLTLAWAISIHKSQGQSFEKVHIDAGRIFAPGQLYVALSRCRSLAGLSFESNITTDKFWANRDVLQFFDDLENVTV
jgi:ATP-dependent exoDNAse (exonuclease V) alpha subunit